MSNDSGGEVTSEVSSNPSNDSPRAHSGNPGASDDDTLRLPDETEPENPFPAILYDEWDADARRYRSRAVSVRIYPPVEHDDQWSTDVLIRHAAIVRQVRHRFERLRARRTLLGRQRAGDELDVAACVNAIVDRHIGVTPDDRLYLDARPARRGMAISLLVDASGSTDTFVTEQLRIVDLERIALLLASEALDALGDLYAINTFAGKTANNVSLTAIKGFSERSGPTIRRRIAGIEPSGFTRLGAAVRHATLQLARQSAGHRLLLLLSDGRPNDVDRIPRLIRRRGFATGDHGGTRVGRVPVLPDDRSGRIGVLAAHLRRDGAHDSPTTRATPARAAWSRARADWSAMTSS